MKATEDIQIEFFNTIGRRLREFDEKHGWIDYFIAPVIVTIILLTVYAIKGVYPFGVNTIAYYDMPTNHVTGYSWLWDVLHGKAGLYLNWNEGLGMSMATGGDAFFPINWFFFFTSRDGILYALSFLLMIKLELISFTMSYYCKKHFNSTCITVCAGVLYTFSGYVLQYYTNIFFLDFVIMFPLIVYALELLVNEHKWIWFTFLMFFVFICNLQLVFMVCIYIVFKVYVLLKSVPNEFKGKSLRLLVICIFIAALTSCFIIVPEYIQLISSVRVESAESFDYFSAMRNVYNYFRRHKQFMMYGSEVAVAALIMILLKGKITIKKYSNNLGMIVLLGIPIIHEGITLLWHAGSYKHFPIRFGYMLSFECIILFGTVLKHEEQIRIKYINRIAKLLGVAVIPFLAYVLFNFFKEFCEIGIGNLNAYHSYWVYFLTLVVIYVIILFINSKPSQYFTLLIVVIIQTSLGCYGLVAPEIAHSDYFRINYVKNSISLRNQLSGMFNGRIKLDMADYDPNDGLIIGKPTIAYWAYGISNSTESELRNNMRYDGAATCVSGTGGTVFTDALLGTKIFATSSSADEVLFERNSKGSGMYDYRYEMPFGIVIDNNAAELLDDSVGFDHNNMLFSALTNEEKELIEIKNADSLVKSCTDLTKDEEDEVNSIYVKNGPKDAYVIPDGSESSIKSENDEQYSENEASEKNNKNENSSGKLKRYDINIPVKGRKALYLSTNDDFSGSFFLMIDSKPFYTESFITHGSYTYPNDVYNGIVTLGGCEEDDLDITIYTENDNLKGLEIGFLDLVLLNEGISKIESYQDLEIDFGKRSMHVKGKVNKTGSLFLPVGYSKNWHAKINGVMVPVKPIINDAFISVDVKEGDIDIEFSYLPEGVVLGRILTAIGLISFVVVAFLIKKGGISEKKYEPIIDKVFIYGFYVVVGVLFAVMYVIPIAIKLSL